MRRDIQRMCPGYLTVYLTLTMAVLLSLLLALIEGVRSNAIRMETECVMEIGMNSILAEYHRELLANYNIFAIDSSYGTPSPGYENTKQHLREYVERNFSLEGVFLEKLLYKDFMAIEVDSINMTGVSILTDKKGAVFRGRAVQAIQDDCNLTLLQELSQWVETVEDNGLGDANVAEQKQKVDDKISSYQGKEVQIADAQWATVEIENPTKELDAIRKKGILKHVLGEDAELSLKQLRSEGLIMDRMSRGQVNQGNLTGIGTEMSGFDQFMERFFFQEYLLKYLGCYGFEKEEGALNYQVEYLLTGGEVDADNLKDTVDKICIIREAANVLYLFSDQEKCKQAEVAALLITALLQVPELMDLVKTAILFGWAYAETIYDIEVLMEGGNVVLLKDAKSWHYSLEDALQVKGMDNERDGASGLSYQDYLRLLMVFVDMDTLTARAMNMVEADIRLTPGNRAFRLDGCFDRVECSLGVISRYGYQYEITRQRGYEQKTI